MSKLSDTSPHTPARPARHTCHDYGRASALCHIKYSDLRNKTSASITRGEIVQLESVIGHCLVSVHITVSTVHMGPGVGWTQQNDNNSSQEVLNCQLNGNRIANEASRPDYKVAVNGHDWIISYASLVGTFNIFHIGVLTGECFGCLSLRTICQGGGWV